MRIGNVVQRFIKMLSDIFVPIIPAIVAGGLLMGLNNLLTSPLVNGQSMIELYPIDVYKRQAQWC